MTQEFSLDDLPRDVKTVLLAVASRCRKGMATVCDAEALEEIVRLSEDQDDQLQKLNT